MVNCEPGLAYQVARDAVDRVDGVSEVHSVAGEYDLIIKCHLPDEQDVGHFVTRQLQTLVGVRRTFTVIAFNPFKSGV